MSIFGDYARYYNLLYQDKEYAAETEFILECLTRHGGMPATLLDLGCGTGRHALEMARRGVCVTGVDMSATMLEMGRQLQAASPDLPAEILPPLLQEGDARTVRLGKRFDAVTSLFHVMSYQNTEKDALAVMETARQHLKPGASFSSTFGMALVSSLTRRPNVTALWKMPIPGYTGTHIPCTGSMITLWKSITTSISQTNSAELNLL